MIELTTLAEQLETALNTNDYGIKFNVKADRNKDMPEQRKSGDYTIYGVLTALSGNFEPLTGIKVYYMPINLELWGYTGLHSLVPFTLEEQKDCVQKVVEGLNGTTQTIGNDTVIFTGAVVTVGGIAQGYDDVRIPILVQMQLTVVEKAVLSNNVVVEIDGETVYANEFSVSMEKQTESFTYIGQAKVESLSAAKMRTFSGMMFLTDTTFYKTLKEDMLANTTLNKIHSLVYDNNTYTVETQTMSEVLRMGAVVVLQVTFIEVA